jgi:phage terminase large subunit-like protein
MPDNPIKLIASDPTEYRRRLIVRGQHGPVPFTSIQAPFQVPILASIDGAFRAVREDRPPTITRIWVEATKGAGKDTLAAMSLLWLLAFTARPLTVQVLAADRSQADELRRAAIGILRQNEWLGELVDVQNWLLLNPHSGSRCEIVASDEAGGHGSRPDIVVINELTHHSDRGPADTAMDNAAKVPANVTIILTNHGRRGTWQWDWRELARTSPRWAFHSFTSPAPWIDQAELSERRRSTNEARFRRLWLGEWVGDDESALADAVLRAAIVLAGPRHCRETDDEQVFAGLDLGISRDRSALAILMRSQGEKTKLAACRSWSPPRGGQIDLSAVEQAVLEAHQIFNFFACFYDPSQAELMAQRLRRAGVPMVGIPFTVATLQEMASCLLETFNSGTIELFAHVQLLADLRALRFIERGNAYRLDAARTSAGHADLATAFVLALLAAKRNPNPWFNPFAPDAHPMISLDDLLKRRDELKLLDDQPAHPSALQRIEQAMPRPADRQTVQMTPMGAALAENGLLNW